jgi:hypothetical protein
MEAVESPTASSDAAAVVAAALDVQVEDLYGDIASVTVRSAVYREYLHLVRTSAGWKIADAFWRPT